MLQNERLENILCYLRINKFATVDELSQQMDVSTMTIRRDLNSLCEKGYIERCHGGAQMPQKLAPETDYSVKKERNQEEKRRIAKRALAFIGENDTVYLDSGTTTFELAKLLCTFPKPVSVVTNDLNIALLLADSPVDVTVTGGNVQKKTQSIMGRASEEFLKQFRFSRAFLGGTSVDYDFNLFSPSYEKAFLKKMILELSAQSYLLVDSSKFFSQSMCLVTGFDRFTGVVTDRKFNEEEQKKLKELGAKVIIV